MPELLEDRAEGELVLGVRPEHVRISDDGWLRGEVYGSEYLGTTQIVTVRTARGQVRARLPAGHERARAASTVGLALKPDKLSIFDGATGRAIRTALHEGGLRSWLDRVRPRSRSASRTCEAVADLSLTIADGEFVVLLGPTGAGKTTTLRLVAGLERADAGIDPHRRRRSDERRSGAARRRLRVPAILALSAPVRLRQSRFPACARPCAAWPRMRSGARVTEIARLLRIEDKLQNPATRLSGGQMQRVAIGRALVRRPSVYLMDEPLSSLDAKLRADLRLELVRIQQELGATILYVTHDQIEAMTMADRIGVMEAGRLVQVGTPRDIYENPSTTYVATRLGHPAVNLIPRGLFPDLARAARTALIGARTEHLRLSKAGGVRAGIKPRRLAVLDRASRRPEPPAPDGRGHGPRHPRRPGERAERRRPRLRGTRTPPLLR